MFSDRNDAGTKAEELMAKILHAGKASNTAWDLETPTKYIEVKSCSAIIPLVGRYKNRVVGKFIIENANHCEMCAQADVYGKKAIYAFVLRVGKHRLWKCVPASEVKISAEKRTNIKWGKIFCPEAYSNEYTTH